MLSAQATTQTDEQNSDTQLSHIRFKITGAFSVFGRPPCIERQESGAQWLLPLGRKLGHLSLSFLILTPLELVSSGAALSKTPSLWLVLPPASGQKETSAQSSLDLYYSTPDVLFFVLLLFLIN